MPTVQLPQTRAEIENAVSEIVWTADHDLWSAETDARHTCSRWTAQEPADPLMIEFFNNLRRVGALEGGCLEALIASSLQLQSKRVRKLGSKRVVRILARGHWRHTQASPGLIKRAA